MKRCDSDNDIDWNFVAVPIFSVVTDLNLWP
jgi:hypothetical protein